MQTSTLILNADYTPLTVVPLSSVHWTAAITAEYLSRAHVVNHYEDWWVRSPSTEMSVPAVMALKDYVAKSRVVKYSRTNIYLRDDYHCQYCENNFWDNVQELTIDHVLPRCLGGESTWDNVVTACGSCNTSKGHFTEMTPRVVPRRPTYKELLERRRQRHIRMPHASWQTYLKWPDHLIVWDIVRRG